jgi:beta propeller repeat protein
MVWPDFSYGDTEILMMNITTKTVTRITNNPYRQEWPDVYNNLIVWADYRNGNSDIYMKDINTGVESRITSNSMNQDIPKIYGSKIVYNDDRNGNADIYLYNLVTKSETRLTPSTQNQYNPQIYGNNIVWDDMINGNSDIYQCLIDTKAPTVSASPVGGIYSTPKIVTLTLNEAGTIYYTTNGTTPTASSSRYINPIIITNTKYLKYFAIDVSNNKSNVYTQKYSIN